MSTKFESSPEEPRPVHPRLGVILECKNPFCRRPFTARSKYHPGQDYCGARECNLIRGRLRGLKHRQPTYYDALFGEKARSRLCKDPQVQTAFFNRQMLFLLVGILADSLATDGREQLSAAVEQLVAK